MWRWLAIAMLAVLLVGCGGSSSTTAPARTLTKTAYGLSLRVSAGWVVLQETDDPAANSPYSVTIQRDHATAGKPTSTLNLQVIRVASPGMAQFILGLPTNPTYRTTKLSGFDAYQSPPQIAYVTLPTATGDTLPTPKAGEPNTTTHVEYDLPMTRFLYLIYTDSVVGDRADPDLAAMIASLKVTDA